MTYYEGMLFFLCLTVVLIPALVLGSLEKPLGRYSLVVSLIIALMVFGTDILQLIYLAGFVLWSWLLVRRYLQIREKMGRHAGLYRFSLLAALVPLILCKVSPLFHMNLFGFTGISYLTFRTVQIIIEAYDGVITQMNAEEFFSFLLFFPTLSSGPIDRSRRFLPDRARVLSKEEYQSLAARGIWKLLLGAVYKFVLSAAVFHVLGYLQDAQAWYQILAYGYVYGVYLFFDFAGYSLMAVGSSYFLGIETPDNFRLPFLSADIRDFWDRWHISLSHWFRDYIFTRLVMHGTRKKWFKNAGKDARLWRACCGFMVNMGIMGLWHGLSPAYIVYGLYHGILLSVFEIYTKKCGFYKKNKDSRWYRVLSWAVTMQLVMFGFLIFSGRLIPA